MTAADHLWRLSPAAMAEAEALIRDLGGFEPDLAAISREALETAPINSFAPDRVTTAWRRLYLSIYDRPQRIVLVGAIDNSPELADLADPVEGLLVVETEAPGVSTAELLPRGAQWRSFSEFGENLDFVDRLRLAMTLINSLQPASVLVHGSLAGWEMLTRHGGALALASRLFATITPTSDLSVVDMLERYVRKCFSDLTKLYGPDQQALRRIASQFGLPASELHKLQSLRDWREPQGFLAPSLGEK